MAKSTKKKQSFHTATSEITSQDPQAVSDSIGKLIGQIVDTYPDNEGMVLSSLNVVPLPGKILIAVVMRIDGVPVAEGGA